MILVDLNVVLDVVQAREPHYQASASVLDIITRNVKDFEKDPLPAYTPEEYLAFGSLGTP